MRLESPNEFTEWIATQGIDSPAPYVTYVALIRRLEFFTIKCFQVQDKGHDPSCCCEVFFAADAGRQCLRKIKPGFVLW